MVIESSDQSDRPCAERRQAFIEVEAAISLSRQQQRLPELSISLEPGIALQVSSAIGVDLAVNFIKKLQAPTTAHRIWLENSPDQEGGIR